ncbi:hypothetical protein ACH47C_13355 [Streptomyces rishiriensis]|uniref:hypothetical protein n=1 Tax=Streptomyces rishiriensis TaxID=68264 RepID=UPI00379AA39F
MVLVAPGDDHGVVADGRPVDADGVSLDDQVTRPLVPGARVEADTGKDPAGLFNAASSPDS